MTLGSLTLLDLLVLVGYGAALAFIGVVLSRRERTTHDFFLAGRRIPWWAAGLSIFGTQLSAITFMAIPAKTYAENWQYFPGNMTIVLIAPLVAYAYLPFFRRLDVTTAYEYLERRFGTAVRWFGSLSFIVFQLGRMAIVVALPSLALAAVTGIDVSLCILAIGLVATLYTVLGGIEAVIWTDVLQVFVLLGGALVSLAVMAGHLALSPSEAIGAAVAEDKLRMFDWTADWSVPAAWIVIAGNLFGNLVPYTTDQTVIQRYLTTKDEADARRAIWTNAVLTVPASVLFFSVGTALFLFYTRSNGAVPPLPDSLSTDAIFPWFIANELPAGLSGLVIAGLFAASMSSLDSSLNSMSTAVVADFYGRLRPASSDAIRLRLARSLTLAFGVVGTGSALALAQLDLQSLWDAFLAVVGLLGSPLAGIFVLGIFTRRTTTTGALVGAACGILALVLAQQVTDMHFLLYAPVGLLTTVAAGWVASMVAPRDRGDTHAFTWFGLPPGATRRGGRHAT